LDLLVLWVQIIEKRMMHWGEKILYIVSKIARKEAKETIHWLAIVAEANPTFTTRMQNIRNEANELKNILSAIIEKAKQNLKGVEI
jgi:hypothetical protein